MIKILEKGQQTFTRTCDRCGCKFQYDLSDLSGLDYISCPCCHTTITHVGPKAIKMDLGKTNKIDYWKDKTPCNFDTGKINVDDIRKHTTTTPYKVEVGNAGYNYATTTGQYVNPNTVTTISDATITVGNPNATIYTGELPDDIVDDPYNNIGMSLPNDIKDNCCYESDDYKAWYEKWCKEIREREPVKCNK